MLHMSVNEQHFIIAYDVSNILPIFCLARKLFQETKLAICICIERLTELVFAKQRTHYKVYRFPNLELRED